MYRDDCIYIDGFYVKDLDIIMDRDLKDLCIVDNSILAFGFHLSNGIPVSSFMGDNKEDQEMLYLASFLEELFYQKDVKKHLSDSFKLTFLQDNVDVTTFKLDQSLQTFVQKNEAMEKLPGR